MKFYSDMWYFASAWISDIDFYMMLSLNSPDYLLLHVFKDETDS